MSAPVAQQTFGLGSLIGSRGSVAPSRISIEAEGRGIFAKLAMHFEFESASSSDEQRLFMVEKPWNAVAAAIVVNGEILDPGTPQEDIIPLASAQFQAVDDALNVPSGHLLTVHIPAGQVLSKIDLEWVLAVDLQWHKGTLCFSSPHEVREVSFTGRWDLSGLPGAGIVFSGAAEKCRLQTLEGSRHRWSESLSISSEQPATMELSLDEKRAASISVFSPSSGDNEGPGCAAVAVVAPVRPQLVRDTVRLAVVIEVRNPQEGLLLRSMVERVITLLKSQDEFTLLLVGTDEPRPLVPWSSSESFSDEMLGKFLDPTIVGRTTDLWSTLQNLSPQLRTSTHLLLATCGEAKFPPKGLLGHTPVFVFATGRRPFRSQLESLSQRSGGFLVDGNVDSLDNLLERMRIRLSPPLLSDFKLEGWGLSQVLPAGATQVYTDQPTLVFGLYEGLLPKTVTLSGQSPAGQKLAQRVKVETLNEVDLMPLYHDRLCRWDGGSEPAKIWKGGDVSATCLTHPDEVCAHFSAPPIDSLAASSAMALAGFEAPTMLMAGSAVSFEAPSLEGESADARDLFAGPGAQTGDFFAGPSAETADVFSGASAETDDFFSASAGEQFFEGAAVPLSDEAELFQHESAEPRPFRAPHIRPREASQDDGDGDADEVDLFEDPSELGPASETPPTENEVSLPSGPPILGMSDSQHAVAETPALAEVLPPMRDIGTPAEEPSLRKKLLSWRQRAESEGMRSEPTAVVETSVDSEPWNSRWLEAFLALDPQTGKLWLNDCSIDHLGLAASLLERTVAEELLARLDDASRRRAVRIQMELGRFLDGYEREEADRQLALALTSSGF